MAIRPPSSPTPRCSPSEPLGRRCRRRQIRSAHHANLSRAGEQPERGLPGRRGRKARGARPASPRRRQAAGGASSSDGHAVDLWRCRSSGGCLMTLLRSCEQDGEKRAAAARAVDEVEDGMVLGLGSGSTAAFAVEAVAARIAKGLRVVAIPSSETTADLGAAARRAAHQLCQTSPYRCHHRWR